MDCACTYGIIRADNGSILCTHSTSNGQDNIACLMSAMHVDNEVRLLFYASIYGIVLITYT